MREHERIADQLRRSVEGDAWYGPSLREALDGVTAERAAARPIAGGHTIWELALHISAWADVVRRRLEGEKIAEPDEGDFPAVKDTSEQAWQQTVAGLEDRLAPATGLALLERLRKNSRPLCEFTCGLHSLNHERGGATNSPYMLGGLRRSLASYCPTTTRSSPQYVTLPIVVSTCSRYVSRSFTRRMRTYRPGSVEDRYMNSPAGVSVRLRSSRLDQ